MQANRHVIAFGPEAPGFGSWEWVGQDLVEELGGAHAVAFRDSVPECDVVVFIKFRPSAEELRVLRQRCFLLFCPVDIYGSAAEIDADVASLRLFDCIILHSPSLSKYFSAYSRVAQLDHHVKFVAPMPLERQIAGPVLWTGNAANLPPLVRWVNRHPIPEELWILTNLEPGVTSPTAYGFNSCNRVRMENWSPEKHREWAGLARGAIDIKGDDFRARHKPPTKAYDFIGSGLPLAMPPSSRPVVDVALRGLQVVDPTDVDHWFSDEYWQQTQVLARQLNQELTRKNIAQRLLSIIDSIQSR